MLAPKPLVVRQAGQQRAIIIGHEAALPACLRR
jgi:hypothetical protein